MKRQKLINTFLETAAMTGGFVFGGIPQLILGIIFIAFGNHVRKTDKLLGTILMILGFILSFQISSATQLALNE